MSEQITITRLEDQGITPVLNLKGRLDASGAEQLRETCMEMLAQETKTLVICVTEVSFVSSSGLGTFLLLTEKFRDNGGRVIYVAPSDSVKQVVALLNLKQFLDIVNSMEEACTVMEA